MALAADRDLIARQYANGFREVFDEACRRCSEDLDGRLRWKTRSSSATCTWLAKHPDSLIARKRGLAEAEEAQPARRAGACDAGMRRDAGQRCADFDAWLRAEGHRRNPGTTADLVDRLLVRGPARGYHTVAVRSSLVAHDWSNTMTERFKVRVTKDHLVFCSGHFISYEGDKCERLHGHNYRAAVEIEGDLDENYYVFDFIALKNRTKAITDELDHRMMLPTRNPHHPRRGTAGRASTSATATANGSSRASDCVLLPIENTTAELLARYIGKRLLDRPEDAASVSARTAARRSGREHRAVGVLRVDGLGHQSSVTGETKPSGLTVSSERSQPRSTSRPCCRSANQGCRSAPRSPSQSGWRRCGLAASVIIRQA